MNQNSKVWSILCVILVLVMLAIFSLSTAVIDPYFHYHAPLEQLTYPLHSQRYQNDGIVKNFDYDALITGTSMTENFKTSELDALFGVNSIKVSFSGAMLSELANNLQHALDHNSNLQLVILCIDQWFFTDDLDLLQVEGSYPIYLYDDNLFNDVEYLLNREIFWGSTLKVLNHTSKGLPTTSFDEYSSWDWGVPRSVANVLESYQRPEQHELVALTEEDLTRLQTSLEYTLVKMARENPNVQFIIYFPPYSALSWDQAMRNGQFDRILGLYEFASQILLEEENIRLFSFSADYETTGNLENYLDFIHHSGEINSLLLQHFRSGEYQLTKETYKDHWNEIRTFYENYDFSAILG